MKKHLFLINLVLIGCNTIRGRVKLEDFHNCVIINQHCGFDNLDGGFYQVRDLKTHKVYRIDVDIRDCDTYKINDTIR